MGFYLYLAGALILTGMGAEAIVRTIRVELAEYRDALGKPDRHGGVARIRKVFLGRLAVNLIEPILALGLGGLILMAIAMDQETLRFMLPLTLLAWLQFRLFRAHIMPPMAVVAMVLFVVGHFLWPEGEANPANVSVSEELSFADLSSNQAQRP